LRIFLLVLAVAVFSCQELPKKYRGEEGKKLLEKYRYQFVEGVVEIDPSLKDQIPEEKHFLIIAVKDKENPMPIAVLRVSDPEFPYKFKITGKDKLREDRFIEGELILTARVSRSQGAEAQKGDLVGSAEARAGQRGVLIKITDKVN